MFCTSCGRHVEAGARFCGSCGKTFAAGGAPAPEGHAATPPPSVASPAPSGIPLCAKCGAALCEGACGACGESGAHLAAPPIVAGIHWVQLRVLFRCSQCGSKSPVDNLAVDGKFFCAPCGQDRMFDPKLWRDTVLPLASAAGDVFWARNGVFPPFELPPESDEAPDDEGGRDHDTADVHKLVRTGVMPHVGVGEAGIEVDTQGMVLSGMGMATRVMSARLTPGHPLCATCHTPLAITPRARGNVSVTCARCGVDETHGVGAEALDACEDLVSAVAEDHVVGRQVARVEAEAGTAALAILCPQCAAPLQPSADGGRLLRCAYCGVASMLPAQATGRGNGFTTTLGAPFFWVGFRAPSGARKAFERITARANERRERREERAATALARATKERGELAHERAARARRRTLIAALAGGGFAVVFGSTLLWLGNHPLSSAEASTTTPTQDSKRSGARTDIVASCTCAFGGDGQSAPRITASFDGPAPGKTGGWGLNIVSKLDFTTSTNRYPLAAHRGAVVPPPEASVRAPLRMGIACAAGIVALVSDREASGWSTIDGTVKWTTKLPAAVNLAAVAATKGDKSEVVCARLTTTHEGRATVSLANHKPMSLNLATGALR